MTQSGDGDGPSANANHGVSEAVSRQALADLQHRIASIHRARVTWWVLFVLGIAVIVLAFSMFASTNDSPGGPGHGGYFWDYFVFSLGVVCLLAAGVLSAFAWGLVGRRIRLSRLKSTACRWQAELDQSGTIPDLYEDGLPDLDEGRWTVTVFKVAAVLTITVVVCSVVIFLSL